MSDNSKYADSAQARQLDRSLEGRDGDKQKQGFAFEPSAAKSQACVERELRMKAASNTALKGALAQMDAFFGSQPAKRNADGIIVSR